MKCPCCKCKLQRIQYEGLNIHQCNNCYGHLLKFERLKAIETRREKTEEILMDELVNAAEDTVDKIRCSRCMKNMVKRIKKIGRFEFGVDRCHQCKLIWLDAGELAKLQVIYESSEKGEEAERFRQRLENMTADEKAAYEDRIAKLPQENIALDILQGIASDWRLGGRFDFFDI